MDQGPYLTTCVGAPSGNTTGVSVCKPGAVLPMSTTKKNILIIGDSVSIGYTPWVAQHMSDVALVQHSPYDVRDGGMSFSSALIDNSQGLKKLHMESSVWTICFEARLGRCSSQISLCSIGGFTMVLLATTQVSLVFR